MPGMNDYDIVSLTPEEFRISSLRSGEDSNDGRTRSSNSLPWQMMQATLPRSLHPQNPPGRADKLPSAAAITNANQVIQHRHFKGLISPNEVSRAVHGYFYVADADTGLVSR